MMNRRAFLRALAGSIFAVPCAVRAQIKKVYRIGYLGSGPPLIPPLRKELEDTLRQLGYIPGQHIVLEYRAAGSDPERLRQMATELVQLPADVIIAESNVAVAAAMQATRTIPIVMSAATGALHAGFVRSLARPGGNVTGLTADPAPETILGKQLAVLKECVPTLARVGVLWNPAAPGYRAYFEILQGQAGQLSVGLESLEVQSPADIETSLRTAQQPRVEGVVVFVDILTFSQQRQIGDLSTRYKLPTVAFFREFADSGGLVSYGVKLAELYRRTAYYVDRIIKGAKPADLPVEQPTQFELVINLKTAKALGLTIPPSLLQRADQVIE
jgi:putative tryptophan/tyrosine transport system substrate-binding protein